MTPEEQVKHVEQMLAFSGEVNQVAEKTMMQSIVPSKGNLVRTELKRLRLMPGFNPRLKTPAYFEHVRNIAESIKSEGFYDDKPIAVVSGRDPENGRVVLFVTEGETRYRAAVLAAEEGAPLVDVPVVIKDKSTTMEDLTVALVRGNTGKPFTPLELAIIAKRLLKFQWSPKVIAEKLGLSEDYISKLLTLAGAPSEIRRMIEAGDVPAAVALEAMRAHGAEAATGVLKDAMAKAKASGQTGLTRKHLPTQVYKRALTKAAPVLVTAVERIRAHNVYDQLPEDLRTEIDKVFEAIQTAKEQLPADAKNAEEADETEMAEAA